MSVMVFSEAAQDLGVGNMAEGRNNLDYLDRLIPNLKMASQFLTDVPVKRDEGC